MRLILTWHFLLQNIYPENGKPIKHPRSQNTQKAEQSQLSSFLKSIRFFFLPHDKKGFLYSNILLQWCSQGSLLSLGENPRDCLDKGCKNSCAIFICRKSGGFLLEKWRYQHNLLEMNRPPNEIRTFFFKTLPDTIIIICFLETRNLLFLHLPLRKWSLTTVAWSSTKPHSIFGTRQYYNNNLNCHLQGTNTVLPILPGNNRVLGFF